MVRTDGSSPAQMFFNRTQKEGLPLLNPNAKPFEPDTLIKKRDKLHDQIIKMRDQHSVIIEDLAPGQEVLTQNYLSGLWNDSAVVLSKREDGRSYWVKDNQGQTFIRGRRRLKAVSQSTDSNQETSNNLVDISISRVTMAMQLNIKTLKAKFHHLPASVVCSASHQPLQIQQEHIRNNTSLCVFYISDKFQPKAKLHSTDFYNFDHPKGLEPFLQHYIVSSETLLHSQSNSITTGPVVPERLVWSQNSVNGTGVSSISSGQKHSGQEVSYQEGSKDYISHTKSLGFHFIEIHQRTVGTMLTLIILFGLLLCCLRFLRFQFLRRQ